MDGKKNVVANAFSRKPQVSTVSILFHDELDLQYAQDEEFCRVFDTLSGGERHNHYTLRDGFL